MEGTLWDKIPFVADDGHVYAGDTRRLLLRNERGVNRVAMADWASNRFKMPVVMGVLDVAPGQKLRVGMKGANGADVLVPTTRCYAKCQNGYTFSFGPDRPIDWVNTDWTWLTPLTAFTGILVILPGRMRESTQYTREDVSLEAWHATHQRTHWKWGNDTPP